MKFYNKTKPLYLEKDASEVGLKAGLQTAQEIKHQTTPYSGPVHL